jgi:predicted ATP-binding protein involved in virulence
MDLNFPGEATIIISTDGYGKTFVTDVQAERTVEFTVDPEWFDQDFLMELGKALRQLDPNLV